MSDAVRDSPDSIMPGVNDNHHFAVPYPVADNVDVVIADADATDDSSELSATLSDNAINAPAPAEQHDLISKTFDLQWKSTATQQEWRPCLRRRGPMVWAKRKKILLFTLDPSN